MIVKTIKSLIATTALFTLLLAPMQVQVAYASYNARGAACEGIGLTGSGCGTTQANNRINSLIELIVNLLSVVVGVVAVIMIIISGLKYVTSGGDSSKIASAKSTLIYAIIGIIIVALAQFIVRFVVNRV